MPLIVGLITVIAGAIWVNTILLWLGGIVVGFTLLLHTAAYVYCLVRDPDLLRSERFVIEKERIVRSDSESGNVTSSEVRDLPETYPDTLKISSGSSEAEL